jgi:hypothetical protein
MVGLICIGPRAQGRVRRQVGEDARTEEVGVDSSGLELRKIAEWGSPQLETLLLLQEVECLQRKFVHSITRKEKSDSLITTC